MRTLVVLSLTFAAAVFPPLSWADGENPAGANSAPASLLEVRLNSEFQNLSELKERKRGIELLQADYDEIISRIRTATKPADTEVLESIRPLEAEIAKGAASTSSAAEYVWFKLEDGFLESTLEESLVSSYLEPANVAASEVLSMEQQSLDASSYRDAALKKLQREFSHLDLPTLIIPNFPATPDGIKALIKWIADSPDLAKAFDVAKAGAIAVVESKKAEEQKKLDELSNLIATSEKTVNDLALASSQGRVGLEKKQLDINTIFAWTISPAFVLVVLVVFLIFRVLPGDVQNEMVRHGILVEVITVFLLVPTVLILGVADVLKSDTIGALLGGIAGYVLGRSLQSGRQNSSSTVTQPAAVPPEPANVAQQTPTGGA